MKQSVRFLAGLSGVALGAALGAAPASAQNRYGAPPYLPYRSQLAPSIAGAPGPAGPQSGLYPGKPVLPGQHTPSGPNVTLLPPEPLGPNSLGLLERDFQYMRATSSNPNNFLYGRWNPRYQTGSSGPSYSYTPGTGYYPYPTYGNFGYGLYGGYGYGNNGYGFGGGPTVVQREYVIIREGNPQASGEARGLPRSERKPDDDFYLGGRSERAADEPISDALDDIRKAWLNGDFGRLRARLRSDGKIRIYLKGDYRYSVESNEFGSMLRDAMARIDTVAFEFDRPKPADGGRAFASGKHTFLDADKARHETYVSYGLQRVNGRWMIVEAGSSSSPISKHVDAPAAGEAVPPSVEKSAPATK